MNETESDWGSNYETALAAAAKDKKIVLANFTGSDWCGWCKRLKAEVFDTPEFREWAGRNAVLLEVDFPQMKQVPADVMRRNDELARKHHIEGYPTILLFNGKGEVVGKMGYQAGGPAKWTRDAEAQIAKAKK